jgi:hypothetical protein
MYGMQSLDSVENASSVVVLLVSPVAKEAWLELSSRSCSDRLAFKCVFRFLNRVFLSFLGEILNDRDSSHSRNDELASEVEVRLRANEEEVLGLEGVKTEGAGVGAKDTVCGLSGLATLCRKGPLAPINDFSLAPVRVGLSFGVDALDLTSAVACFLNFDSKARGLRLLEGLPVPISRVLAR